MKTDIQVERWPIELEALRENDFDLDLDLHPTMKPVELIERAIRNSSKSRDVVLDPFAGSGSTLIAHRLREKGSPGAADRTGAEVLRCHHPAF